MRETKWIGRGIVGPVVVVGFIAACALTFSKVIHADMKDVALTLLGVLAGKFGTVVDYYFGSSAGSADKTDALKDAAKKP